MKEFLINNWQSIAIVIGPIVTWFASKKDLFKKKILMSQADIESREIENITQNFKVYQDLITDLEERFKTRIDDLELDLDKMKELNLELRKIISNQEKYTKRMKAKLEEYEKLERKN